MDNFNEFKTLSVTNKIDQLARVAKFIEDIGTSWNLPPSLVFNINLVVEEALSNTILYGYVDSENHVIEIEFRKSDDKLFVTIKDDGLEFDPTKKRDPDTTLSAEERPIGGLGVFLIKQLMDNVEYKREGKTNYLTLTKNISL